ncbi:hypothetical protein [Rhizobium chutanense]|uniref:hypothetical protein n=1 Tax=Rhizobium chutanense TaxID=2035448 RepID=UPI00117B0D07|nr:hypothetical protein [Rhizobium chutanense]
MDVLFTRLAWQTKVKIITENEKPKQMPAAPQPTQDVAFPSVIAYLRNDISFQGPSIVPKKTFVALEGSIAPLNDSSLKEASP